MNNELLRKVQKQINYNFEEPELLQQAFTRKSYAEENPGTQDNEVLEFYGDKAMEFIVMKKMSYFYRNEENEEAYVSQKNEGQLTEIKKKLVNKSMLAHRMDRLGFHKYLLMGNGDILQRVQNDDSVKEDLFEAIIGAVAIDSQWDVTKIEKVVDVMLDVNYYLNEDSDEDSDEDQNYIDLIQQWFQKKFGCPPMYDFSKSREGYYCELVIPGIKETFEGCGLSKKEARMNAARCAYFELIDNDGLFSTPINEIGEPDVNKAINQLQELFQKGYIQEPTYIFSEQKDTNGNPIWGCECHVEGIDTYCYGNFSSKKVGKKEVAFKMLCEILNWGIQV